MSDAMAKRQGNGNGKPDKRKFTPRTQPTTLQTAERAMPNIEDKIKQMPTIVELIYADLNKLTNPFEVLVSNYLKSRDGLDGLEQDGSDALAIGVAVAIGMFPAFGRRGAVDAPYERMKPNFVAFDDLEPSTSSVTAFRSVRCDEGDEGAMPLEWHPGEYTKNEHTLWHEVRLCHPVDVPPITANLAWLNDGTPLDMIYERYVLNDSFVQMTRQKASAAHDVFAAADAAAKVNTAYLSQEIYPAIVPPPWRRSGHSFGKAYWEAIQAAAQAPSIVPTSEMPEAVQLFITAVRYPLHRLLFLLDRGELIGHGIHPLTKARKRIERLFWRRENITIDFETGDIFNARTGELEWAYVTICAAPGGESVGIGTIDKNDDPNKKSKLGRHIDDEWMKAFDYLCNHPNETKRLNLQKLPVSATELSAMLWGAAKELNEKSGKTLDNAESWIYYNLRPLQKLILDKGKKGE